MKLWKHWIGEYKNQHLALMSLRPVYILGEWLLVPSCSLESSRLLFNYTLQIQVHLPNINTSAKETKFTATNLLSYFCNPMLKAFDISNYDFCWIKKSKFEILKVLHCNVAKIKNLVTCLRLNHMTMILHCHWWIFWSSDTDVCQN